MSKRFTVVFLVLVLVGSLDDQDSRAIVHMLALLAAIVLYPVAVAVIVIVLASPLVVGVCLFWRFGHGGVFSAHVHTVARCVWERRPWAYRLSLERRQNQPAGGIRSGHDERTRDRQAANADA
jgi:hypothetical protein